jgi:hypothetical protein
MYKNKTTYSSLFFFQSLEDLDFSSLHYFKFMFVRDPMERLYSCYQDKMVSNPHWSLQPFRNAVKNRARSILAERTSNKGG